MKVHKGMNWLYVNTECGWINLDNVDMIKFREPFEEENKGKDYMSIKIFMRGEKVALTFDMPRERANEIEDEIGMRSKSYLEIENKGDIK